MTSYFYRNDVIIAPFVLDYLHFKEFNILLAYFLAFSYGKSPQTSKLDGEDTLVLIK